MRLLPSDPDVETLVGRIDKGELDLQPDFQRGEVWSLSKRQRLIDSILRDWHVPPIHVIQNEDQTVAVLDGQQRLAAIRDFVHGRFLIDGDLPPADDRIRQLGGLQFSSLPNSDQRRFLRFPIRLFTIVDYKPSEPGELFYRLNQLSSLTSAEQRNAFFGITRKQVKALVETVEEIGIGGNLLGFSNARMSYDDVIARSLFLLDAKTLRRKVTAGALAERYRSDTPFSPQAVNGVKNALDVMGLAQKRCPKDIRLNKATAQTWIVFLATAPRFFVSSSEVQEFLADFMVRFEVARSAFVGNVYGLSSGDAVEGQNSLVHVVHADGNLRQALSEYDDRATSRVADISSVILRDFVIWLFLLTENQFLGVLSPDDKRRRLEKSLKSGTLDIVSLEELADDLAWGSQL